MVILIKVLPLKLFNQNYPGVTFSYVKRPHNTVNSGLPHPDSPAKTGITVTQGKTYNIWIVE